MRGNQPEFGEFGAQLGGYRKGDRMNPERAGSASIRDPVIDIDGAFRTDRKAPD